MFTFKNRRRYSCYRASQRFYDMGGWSKKELYPHQGEAAVSCCRNRTTTAWSTRRTWGRSMTSSKKRCTKQRSTHGPATCLVRLARNSSALHITILHIAFAYSQHWLIVSSSSQRKLTISLTTYDLSTQFDQAGNQESQVILAHTQIGSIITFWATAAITRNGKSMRTSTTNRSSERSSISRIVGSLLEQKY